MYQLIKTSSFIRILILLYWTCIFGYEVIISFYHTIWVSFRQFWTCTFMFATQVNKFCTYRCTGPVSFRGAEVCCPNIFSIACPNIKWFCPNITGFFARKWLLEKILGGLQPPPPPASYAYGSAHGIIYSDKLNEGGRLSNVSAKSEWIIKKYYLHPHDCCLSVTHHFYFTFHFNLL